MKKTYHIPQFRVLKLSGCALLADSNIIKLSMDNNKKDADSDRSKAFWGPSLFDDEDDDDVIDAGN